MQIPTFEEWFKNREDALLEEGLTNEEISERYQQYVEDYPDMEGDYLYDHQ